MSLRNKLAHLFRATPRSTDVDGDAACDQGTNKREIIYYRIARIDAVLALLEAVAQNGLTG
jgi:hypothetical protein